MPRAASSAAFGLSRVCRAAAPLLVLPLLLLASDGCDVIAATGAMTNYTTITPAYTGFKGQSVGVMAWAGEAIRFDHDALILDITHGVSTKLKGAQGRKASELEGATFPRSASPDALYAFQSNHPDLEAEPIVNVAPRLGVTRLLYIEIDGFNLHSGAVLELARGELSGTVQVIEVSGGRTARVTFHDTVLAVFPPRSPEEGTPGISDKDNYVGTVDAFCTAVAQKFISHPAENGHH